jgi:16S rRNA (adenine1518-N6/adenine1519-N6)-dimethyltransferase
MTEPGSQPVLPPLREVIARYGLHPRRALGQNFLLDLNLTARIARAAGKIDEGTVIEIGPGPGGLTRALLAQGAAEVIAIERDRRFLPALADIQAAYPGRLQVIEGDALKIDVGHLGKPPRRIVANLPYNIATPLLIDWLKRGRVLAGLTIMLQTEVAERLAAKPRSKDYGRLSVLVQWLAEIQRLFDVPARAFSPPPKVSSSIVQLIPREKPLFPAELAVLERVTQAAFGQRRKMLRQSLKRLAPDPVALMVQAGIEPTDRAEQLSVEQFCALARAVAAERRPGGHFTAPRADP